SLQIAITGGAWGGALGPPMYSIGEAISGSAMSLVVLFSHAEGIALPFGDERQARKILHAVDVHDALEVVGLVLDHPGEKLLGHEVHLLAGAIAALETNLSEPRHASAHVGHRQAPFPAVFDLLGQR